MDIILIKFVTTFKIVFMDIQKVVGDFVMKILIFLDLLVINYQSNFVQKI